MPHSSTPPGVVSLGETGGTQLKGAVTLTEGTNITITQSGRAITIAAAGGTAVPQFIYKPEVTASGYLLTNTSNSGSITYGDKLGCVTGTTANSYANGTNSYGNSRTRAARGNNHFAVMISNGITGTDFEFFIGVANLTLSGTAISFTSSSQYGFKVIRSASVSTTSCTNSNGTTETATSFTPTDLTDDQYIWMAVKTGTTNIKFYENETLRATHSTNLPGETDNIYMFYMIANNKNTATTSTLQQRSYTYSRDTY